MANIYGFRILVAYYEGRANKANLDAALAKGWITQAEHDRAMSGQPPEGYVVPMVKVAEASAE